MYVQAESAGLLKQEEWVCSKRSSFSQSVSMHDYYINNGEKMSGTNAVAYIYFTYSNGILSKIAFFCLFIISIVG
jgi:hypothetical protein